MNQRELEILERMLEWCERCHDSTAHYDPMKDQPEEEGQPRIHVRICGRCSFITGELDALIAYAQRQERKRQEREVAGR